MGWRDRDYARWTDEERRRFYGSSTSGKRAPGTGYAAGSGQGRLFGQRVGVVAGALLAVIVSFLVALLLGRIPHGHPIVPAFHFDFPSLAGPATTGSLALPGRLPLNSTLTLHGRLPPGENGMVTVAGRYGQSAWRVLATVPSSGGAYQARIPIDQQGELHVRVTYPDGHEAVGSTEVG